MSAWARLGIVFPSLPSVFNNGEMGSTGDLTSYPKPWALAKALEAEWTWKRLRVQASGTVTLDTGGGPNHDQPQTEPFVFDATFGSAEGADWSAVGETPWEEGGRTFTYGADIAIDGIETPGGYDSVHVEIGIDIDGLWVLQTREFVKRIEAWIMVRSSSGDSFERLSSYEGGTNDATFGPPFLFAGENLPAARSDDAGAGSLNLTISLTSFTLDVDETFASPPPLN